MKDDSTSSGNVSGFHSRDCIDIVLDGPGDTTVRPSRPVLRKLAEAQRERLARWEREQASERSPSEPPSPGPATPEQGDRKNGTAG
jgi:anti-sigma factor RsiW